MGSQKLTGSFRVPQIFLAASGGDVYYNSRVIYWSTSTTCSYMLLQGRAIIGTTCLIGSTTKWTVIPLDSICSYFTPYKPRPITFLVFQGSKVMTEWTHESSNFFGALGYNKRPSCNECDQICHGKEHFQNFPRYHVWRPIRSHKIERMETEVQMWNGKRFLILQISAGSYQKTPSDLSCNCLECQ